MSFYLTAPFTIWSTTGSGNLDFYVGLITYPVVLTSFFGISKLWKKEKTITLFSILSILLFIFGLIFFAKNALTRYVVPIMPYIMIFSVYSVVREND